jgi:hypothetical protein
MTTTIGNGSSIQAINLRRELKKKGYVKKVVRKIAEGKAINIIIKKQSN